FSNGLVPEGEAEELRNVRQSMARFVMPGYFEAMGLPIVKGRGFQPSDREGSPLVMVINQTLAQRLWPNQDPIGRRVNGSSREGPEGASRNGLVGKRPEVRGGRRRRRALRRAGRSGRSGVLPADRADRRGRL